VAPVHVVTAEAGHDREPFGGDAGEQEAQQIAGRLVGPVDVLHHQQHRLLLRAPRQRAEHRLEKLATVDAVLRASNGRPAARQQALDRWVCGEQLLDILGPLGGESAKRFA